MNIGVDIRSLLTARLTGVGEYTYHLLNHLFAIDTHNEYYLFYNAYKLPGHIRALWSKAPNVHHAPHTIPNKLLNASLITLKWPAINRMAAEKLDCFLSPNPYFAAYSTDTRILQIIHDLTPLLHPEFFSTKIRWGQRYIYPASFKKAAHFIAVSHNTARDLNALCSVGANKITTLYPGLDPLFKTRASPARCREVKQKYALPDKFILFLGTIEPRKNIESLIRAYELWAPHDTTLVIAGKAGWLSGPILRMARMSPRASSIRWIDYIEHHDKPALYALAQLFVYPSFYEGFGFPPLEALSQGTAVMVSHTSSMGELFGNHALLIDPWQPGELAGLFEEYLKCNEHLHPRAERIAFANSFQWEQTAHRIHTLMTQS